MPRAARERSPNQRLREMIAACGMSYDAVARAVVRVAAENGEVLRTNRSAIAHWVAGTAPGERTTAYLTEALSRRAGRPVTPEQIGLPASLDPLPSSAGPAREVSALARADVDHRGFLATAVYTATDASLPLGYDHEPAARLLRARTGQARAGAGEVAVVRQVTRAFGAADEVLGGGHGLSAVAAYLADTAVPCCPRGSPASTAAGKRSPQQPSWPGCLAGSTMTWDRRELRRPTTGRGSGSPPRRTRTGTPPG